MNRIDKRYDEAEWQGLAPTPTSQPLAERPLLRYSTYEVDILVTAFE